MRMCVQRTGVKIPTWHRLPVSAVRHPSHGRGGVAVRRGDACVAFMGRLTIGGKRGSDEEESAKPERSPRRYDGDRGGPSGPSGRGRGRGRDEDRRGGRGAQAVVGNAFDGSYFKKPIDLTTPQRVGDIITPEYLKWVDQRLFYFGESDIAPDRLEAIKFGHHWDSAKRSKRARRANKSRDGWEPRVLEIKRVCHVRKGGRRYAFRAVAVGGDRKGSVGVGVGHANVVLQAIQKANTSAKKKAIKVAISPTKSILHAADAKQSGAKIRLWPRGDGNGIKASVVVKTVLSLAGYENVTTRCMGSRNIMNNAKAIMKALAAQKLPEERAAAEGITVQELSEKEKREEYFKRNKPFKEFKWMSGYDWNPVLPLL